MLGVAACAVLWCARRSTEMKLPTEADTRTWFVLRAMSYLVFLSYIESCGQEHMVCIASCALRPLPARAAATLSLALDCLERGLCSGVPASRAVVRRQGCQRRRKRERGAVCCVLWPCCDCVRAAADGGAACEHAFLSVIALCCAWHVSAAASVWHAVPPSLANGCLVKVRVRWCAHVVRAGLRRI